MLCSDRECEKVSSKIWQAGRTAQFIEERWKKKSDDRQSFPQCNLSCSTLQTKCQTTFLLYMGRSSTKKHPRSAKHSCFSTNFCVIFISGTNTSFTGKKALNSIHTHTHIQAMKSSLIKMSKGDSTIHDTHAPTHSNGTKAFGHMLTYKNEGIWIIIGYECFPCSTWNVFSWALMSNHVRFCNGKWKSCYACDLIEFLVWHKQTALMISSEKPWICMWRNVKRSKRVAFSNCSTLKEQNRMSE